MTGKEKALKVSLLEKILLEEYGIENRVQFMEAYSKLKPIDISIFACSLPSRQSGDETF